MPNTLWKPVLQCLTVCRAIWFAAFGALTAQPTSLLQGEELRNPPARAALSVAALALQGLWKLEGGDENPVTMARLVVHGTYLLLVYQFPGRDARVIEIAGFRADDWIRDMQGNPVIDYMLGENDHLNLEITDEGPDLTSRFTEIVLVKAGRFPDLGL